MIEQLFPGASRLAPTMKPLHEILSPSATPTCPLEVPAMAVLTSIPLVVTQADSIGSLVIKLIGHQNLSQWARRAHLHGQFGPTAPGFGIFSPVFAHPCGVSHGGGAPYFDLPSPIDVNKRRERNASDPPSISPSLRRRFSVDMRSMLPDLDDSGLDSQPKRNTAPHGQQHFSLSQETRFFMERMRSTLEDFMKSVSKSDFESSELLPIYTKAFKDRCFAAIERGDFVPLGAFMCSTGKKDLRKKTLPQALLDRRKSRQRPSCKAIANGQSSFTSDFANKVPEHACHLCHQKLHDLFWHILGKSFC